MNKTIKLSFAILLSIAAVSCGNKSANQTDEAAMSTISVDGLMAHATDLVGDTIEVEAPCSHLCSQGGKKAFLVGSADTLLLRCEAYPLMGTPFPKDCIHKTLRVKGVVREQRIDSAAVAEMESQYAARFAAENTAAENGSSTDTAAQPRQSGCDTERTAQGQRELTTFDERMADYRKRIAERYAAENIPYLSFYYLDAIAYEIVAEP